MTVDWLCVPRCRLPSPASGRQTAAKRAGGSIPSSPVGWREHVPEEQYTYTGADPAANSALSR